MKDEIRYRLPDPRCIHRPTQRVEAGSPSTGPHASTWVCARPGCVEDALAWAWASTRLEPRVIPFGLDLR